MNLTNEELKLFKNWIKNDYNYDGCIYEREEILTKESLITLSDEEIKKYFTITKRNNVEVKPNLYAEFSIKEIVPFNCTIISYLTKTFKRLKHINKLKENIDKMFHSPSDLSFTKELRNKIINTIIEKKENTLYFQDIVNMVIGDNYYSIPCGESRTIEKYHYGEVLNAIYCNMGGVALVKTKRKIIGVELKKGSNNCITPIPLKKTIEKIEEIKQNMIIQYNVDNDSLKSLKEKIIMDEVAKTL